MTKLDNQCTRCRRAGQKLFLKGDKCLGPKCLMVKRNFAPGQHGPVKKQRKVSGYGKQLKEKQSAKRTYGLRERQFSNYVTEASGMTGDTSKILIQYLEARLDNVVYRANIGKSRTAARQIVNHGHVTVNGKKLDIPSYRTKVGDVIAIAPKALKKKIFENITETLTKTQAPSWLGLDIKSASAKVLNTPFVDSVPFSPKDIIEFYSR
ncbi:MAG: 30S ribosomal protein S4 [bacterium]|nr:30S ribosomal protein S4 [bacterium]